MLVTFQATLTEESFSLRCIADGDETYNSSPKMPSHLCCGGKPLVAFFLFCNKLKELKVSEQLSTLTPKGREITLEVSESRPRSTLCTISKVFKEVFPNMYSYMGLKSLLSEEEFQKKIEVSSREELIKEHNRLTCEKMTPTENSLELPAIENAVSFGARPIDPSIVEDFFRRVSPEELAILEEKLLSVEFGEKELIALKERDLSHPIFQTDWDLVALKAFRTGHLDLDLLSTLLLLYEARRSYSPEKIQYHRLFDIEGTVSEEAKQALIAGLNGYLNEKEQEHFFTLLKTVPSNHSQFLVVEREAAPKDICNLDNNEIYKYPISYVLYHAVEYGLLFHYSEPKSNVHQTVISPLMYHALLIAKWGSQASRPVPVLGISKGDDFEHPNQRVALIPCRHFSHPDIADNYQAPPLDFYHHDLYHLWVESANPHRSAWIKLAKSFKDNHRIKIWKWLLDREFSSYYSERGAQQLKKKKLTPQEAFWLTVSQLDFLCYSLNGERNADLFLPMLMGFIKAEQAVFKAWGIDFNDLRKIQAEVNYTYFNHLIDMLNSYQTELFLGLESTAWALRV